MTGMIPKEVETAFLRDGYHFCRVMPDDIGIFYQYGQENVRIIAVVDLTQGYEMTVQQHAVMEERIQEVFSHPEGKMEGDIDICMIYPAEILTLLVGNDMSVMRRMCAVCANTWGYLAERGQLLIYENQPGDFYGLQNILEMTEAQNMRTEAGAWKQSVSKRDFRTLPYITALLAAANILIYVILEFLGDTTNGGFIANHGGMFPDYVRDDGEWWRLITAGFVHFGMEHLLNNMVMLCCIGSRLERVIGHIRMAAVYLMSLLAGSLLSYFMMLKTQDYAVSAGASGAVFGLIGGLLWAVIWHKGRLEDLTTRGMILMAALSLYFGFVTIEIDQWAHLGGMLAGFIGTAILYHRKNQKC